MSSKQQLSKEEVLQKHIDNDGRVMIVFGRMRSVSLAAMDEYAKQESIAFGIWVAKNNYCTTTLPHEEPQLWEQVEYDITTFKRISPDTEYTTEELYNLYKNQKT